MKRFALTLDLKSDPELIAQYIAHHENVWPEVLDSIYASGIKSMEIYQVADRLFMMLEVADDFTFEEKAALDANNPKVQAWETLMDTYQKRLPFAKGDEKWVLMNKIFQL